MLTTYPHAQPDPSNVAYFGCCHSPGLRFGDYNPSSRALTAANWGNRTIRTATRRRHADSQLLMLPNPHAWDTGGTGGPDCGAHGRRPGLTTVPAGGGQAWPGFEPTRRAKLTARTSRSADVSRRGGSRAGRRPRRSPAQTCTNPAPRMRDGVSPTQSGGRV